jgi:hypothetical protein
MSYRTKRGVELKSRQLVGQKPVNEEAPREPGSDGEKQAASHDEAEDRTSSADQAKENERQAEEEGRELPG